MLELEMEKLAMKKRRFEEEMALGRRCIEEDTKKEWLRDVVFFAAMTISAVILGGSFSSWTKGCQPATQDIGSSLRSFERWLCSPLSVKLHGDIAELAKLSDVTSGK